MCRRLQKALSTPYGSSNIHKTERYEFVGLQVGSGIYDTSAFDLIVVAHY